MIQLFKTYINKTRRSPRVMPTYIENGMIYYYVVEKDRVLPEKHQCRIEAFAQTYKLLVLDTDD